MQLSLQNANLQELRGSFGSLWLRLLNLTELTTSIEKQGESTALNDLTAKSAQLEIKIPIKDGELIFAQPIELAGLSADLLLGATPTINARLSAIKVSGLSLKLGALSLRLQADASQVLIERLPVGDTILYFHTLSLQKVSAQRGDLEVNAEEIDLRALRVTLGRDSLQISLPDATMSQLSARDKEMMLRVMSLTASENISFNKQATSIGQLHIHEIQASYTFTPNPETKEKRPAPPLDLRLLDGLEGKLHADIDVKVRVPVIGHRHAVHEIRLPIEGGAINFIELKNNLAFLEGSLIDFAIEGDELILQRDLPLIPDKPKPIIYWKLDADGLRLAGQEKVLLRALPNARLATDDEPKDETKRSPLEHLMIRALTLNVTLFSQEAFSLEGILPKLSIEQLTVKGDLHHKPAQATTPTQIEIMLSNLITALFRFPLGARMLDVRSIELGAMTPCALTMNGVTPASVHATLSNLKLRGVSL